MGNLSNNIQNENIEFVVLINKWEVFLNKINARFNESLIQAENALLENLIASDFNITPTLTAWSGMKAQILSLSKKIEHTFNHVVKPKMAKFKEEWDLIEQDQKGIQLGESFYTKMERFEMELLGKISEKFYQHAIQLLNETFHCKQCSAKLEVKKNIFRSHYVSCDYCNTVNTFVPNSKINEIQNFAIDNIARYKSLAEFDNMLSAQKQLNNLSFLDDPENFEKNKKLFSKREQSEIKYWTKFLKERIKLQPEFEKTFQHDLNIKMKNFYLERKRKLGY